jgi:hypothetical protein
VHIFAFCRNKNLLADPTRLRQINERIPAGRWGDPADFAGPIVFLASKASQYVCGEVLVVDGVSLPSLLSLVFGYFLLCSSISFLAFFSLPFCFSFSGHVFVCLRD